MEDEFQDPLSPTPEDLVDEESNEDPLAPPEPTQPSASPQAKPDPNAERIAQVEKELETLRQHNRELAESERYWSDRAKAQGGHAEEPAPKEAPAPKKLTTEEFMEALEERGPDAILDVVKSAGFVPRDEAERMAREIAETRLQAEREVIKQEAQIFREFPDLADESSEHYAETKKVFQEMVNDDPRLANSTAAFKAAARLAQKTVGTRSRSAGGNTLTERFLGGRDERIAAQRDGNRMQSTSDADEELTPSQLNIAKQMGVSAKEYTQFAKRGVKISGIPRR